MLTHYQRDLLLYALRSMEYSSIRLEAIYIVSSLADVSQFARSAMNAYQRIDRLYKQLSHEQESRRILDGINAELHARLLEQEAYIKTISSSMTKYYKSLSASQYLAVEVRNERLRIRELHVYLLEREQQISSAEDELKYLKGQNVSLADRLAKCYSSREDAYYEVYSQQKKLIYLSAYSEVQANALLNYISETTNLRYAITNCLLTLQENEALISNLRSHSKQLEVDFSYVVAALVYTYKTATNQAAVSYYQQIELLNQKNSTALKEGNLAYATELVFAELQRSDLYVQQRETQIDSLYAEIYYLKDENYALILRYNQQASEFQVKNTLIQETMARNRDLMAENIRMSAENMILKDELTRFQRYLLGTAPSTAPVLDLENTSENPYDLGENVKSKIREVVYQYGRQQQAITDQSRDGGRNDDLETCAADDDNMAERSSVSYHSYHSSAHVTRCSGISAAEEYEEEYGAQLYEGEYLPQIDRKASISVTSGEKSLDSVISLQETKPANEKPDQPVEKVAKAELKPPVKIDTGVTILPRQRPPKHPLKRVTDYMQDVLNLTYMPNMSYNQSSLAEISLLADNEKHRADLNMIDSGFGVYEDAELQPPPDVETYQEFNRFLTQKEKAGTEQPKPFDNDISINYESIMEAKEEYNPKIIVDQVSTHESMLNDDVDGMISQHDNNADKSITYVDGVYFGNIEKVGAQRDDVANRSDNNTINSFAAEQQNLRIKQKIFKKRVY